MKSRELTQIECVALLTTSHYGRLGLSCEEQPYVIPMSYAYSNEKLYLHSRGAGEKLNIAQNNPKVCFEVDLLDKNRWTSVIAYGMVSISTDVEECLTHLFVRVWRATDANTSGGKNWVH